MYARRVDGGLCKAYYAPGGRFVYRLYVSRIACPLLKELTLTGLDRRSLCAVPRLGVPNGHEDDTYVGPKAECLNKQSRIDKC